MKGKLCLWAARWTLSEDSEEESGSFFYPRPPETKTERRWRGEQEEKERKETWFIEKMRRAKEDRGSKKEMKKKTVGKETEKERKWQTIEGWKEEKKGGKGGSGRKEGWMRGEYKKRDEGGEESQLLTRGFWTSSCIQPVNHLRLYLWRFSCDEFVWVPVRFSRKLAGHIHWLSQSDNQNSPEAFWVISLL